MKNKKFTFLKILAFAYAFIAYANFNSLSAQVVTCTTAGENITINTGDDAFAGEIGWELYNTTTGEVVAYERTFRSFRSESIH